MTKKTSDRLIEVMATLGAGMLAGERDFEHRFLTDDDIDSLHNMATRILKKGDPGN